MTIRLVISGGQTGADRGGLEGARDAGIEIGGWCPKGRRAEDGPIPDRYPVREMTSKSYPARTKANVRDADVTVIFVHGAVTRGSRLTKKICEELSKPFAIIDLQSVDNLTASELLREFVMSHKAATLNVAGSRESVAPGIQGRVRRIVMLALEPSRAGWIGSWSWPQCT